MRWNRRFEICPFLTPAKNNYVNKDVNEVEWWDGGRVR